MKHLYFLLILFFYIDAYAQGQVFFTPSADCENNIVSSIQNSKRKIDVAVYAINNDVIVNALKKAHQNGVQVRILTDRLQAGQKSSKVKELEKAGIPLIRHKKFKIQHDKFAIFDETKAVTGSYNWTNAASKNNAENCFFFSDENVTEYTKRFEHLWNLNQKELQCGQ